MNSHLGPREAQSQVKAPRLQRKITNYERKNVDELRAHLTARNLGTAGLKPMLVARSLIWELGLSHSSNVNDLEHRAKDLATKSVDELKIMVQRRGIPLQGYKIDLIGELLLDETHQPSATLQEQPDPVPQQHQATPPAEQHPDLTTQLSTQATTTGLSRCAKSITPL